MTGAPASAASILIAEDEPGAREALAELLADAGYRVRSAAGGAQALALAHGDPPELLISDVMMPDMDGFELARRLRADHPDEFVPVILISGLGDPDRRAHGLDLGADDYMVKPIDFDELLARVRVQLRHAARQRQLLRMASVDDLTGALNRRGLFHVLAHDLARLGDGLDHLAVVLVDVNHFKMINDRYGHAVGDIVLRWVAQALAGQVRAGDVVGRLGGDEFLVILPGGDRGQADGLLRRMGNMRGLPSLHALGVDHDVTVAAGAASARPGDSPDKLIERADLAMYHDKGRTPQR
ncbi:MAG TPA: diguanylate cyclase [Kofleriaceae bacterium]|nr:diguanylate cyclase [Kofleriaceae bacterium]